MAYSSHWALQMCMWAYMMFKRALDDALIQRIQSVLEPLEIADETHTPKREGQRPASVLMPLVKRDEEWRVLLTRRPMHMKNHAGQVSFPGGKTEAGETPCAGALRETHEEVGIAQEDIHLLGRLSSFNAVSDFRITPYVGIFSPEAEIIPEAGEVEEAFEIPFSFFMSRNNHVRREVQFENENFILYDMPWPSAENRVHHVWGMTAMILHQLYKRMGDEAR